MSSMSESRVLRVDLNVSVVNAWDVGSPTASSARRSVFVGGGGRGSGRARTGERPFVAEGLVPRSGLRDRVRTSRWIAARTSRAVDSRGDARGNSCQRPVKAINGCVDWPGGRG